jgi:hypothetical protein
MKTILTIIMLCGVMSGYAQSTPPHAASTRTWVIKANGVTQTWSDHINLPACNKPDFYGNSKEGDCRKNSPGYYYLYSWLYVIQHTKELCPSPWRVPSKSDFVVVASATTSWGNVRGGFVYDSGTYISSNPWYWCTTLIESDQAWFYDADTQSVRSQYLNLGLGVRCVK